MVMTEADGGAGPDARPGWQWDVALSFAGAQRDYVEQVAQALKARGVRCFYDADEQIDLWGKYLAEELPLIYGAQAAAVVVFVSAEYAARDWTRLERRSALNRAVRERREYVLPAQFDDTPLPGLLSDMVAIDLRTRTPQQFAAMIAAKLAALGIIEIAIAVIAPTASSKSSGIIPAALSEDLRGALDSAHPYIRKGAVGVLGEWLTGSDPAKTLTARQTLLHIAANDMPAVATAAREQLDRWVRAHEEAYWNALAEAQMSSDIKLTRDQVISIMTALNSEKVREEARQMRLQVHKSVLDSLGLNPPDPPADPDH
jgi:hypothetical protein